MHKHADLDLQGVRVGFKENIDSLYMKVAFQLFISHTIPANDIILLAFLCAGNNYRNFGQVQNLPGQTLTTAHEEKQ
jgi:hypothetical protein